MKRATSHASREDDLLRKVEVFGVDEKETMRQFGQELMYFGKELKRGESGDEGSEQYYLEIDKRAVSCFTQL